MYHDYFLIKINNPATISSNSLLYMSEIPSNQIGILSDSGHNFDEETTPLSYDL